MHDADNVKVVRKLIDKTRECHNHKQQPTTDTKRKRKRTNTNTCKRNKNAREGHRPAPSSPGGVITKKHEDKEQGKTLKHEAPRSMNHKATQNKNNTGTTALERSVAQTAGWFKRRLNLTTDAKTHGKVSLVCKKKAFYMSWKLMVYIWAKVVEKHL